MGRFYDFKKFRFLPFYSRVENISISNYWGGDDGKIVPFYFEGVPFASFRIDRIYPNQLYGKENKYILEESGFYRSPVEYGMRISPECFKNKESRAAIGQFVEINNDELAISLNLNERVFERSDAERLILFTLAKEAHNFIREQLNNNIEDDDYDD